MCSNQTNKAIGRDEYIDKVTVGEHESHNVEIILNEYDSNWPILFKREADKICSALGEKVLQIEHVGSTSVPGLCAKPIVDILLVVTDSSDEFSYLPKPKLFRK